MINKRFFLAAMGYLLVGSTYAAGPADEVAQEARQFYPPISCNTKDAVDGLRARFANARPFYDGDAPWPGVYGVWVNSERGIYLKVESKKPEGSTLPVLNVGVFDVCNDKPVAEGELRLELGDWKKPNMVVTVKGSGFLRKDTKLDIVYKEGPKDGTPQIEVGVTLLSKVKEEQDRGSVDKFLANKISPN
jgi:hypothetical protein